MTARPGSERRDLRTKATTSSADVEKLTGGKGDDVIAGDIGNETLNGGAGDDNLNGRQGNDVTERPEWG